MTPYAMLYTIAAGIPILLAALAVAAVLRKYGRSERGVWLAAMVLALVIPAVALLDPLREDAASATAPVASVGVVGLPEFLVVPVQASALNVSALILLLWLSGSGLLIARWAIAAHRLAKASRNWAPDELDGLPVWMTDNIGPAVSGIFRPRVLVPAWLLTLPAPERALVLMHEQEHIRARDPLLIAFTRAARILTPWNPVVWLLSFRLVRAVELDCDRRVLRRTEDVAAYGHTLLTVSARRPSPLVLAAAFAESEAPLRSRILAMTTPSRTISVAAIMASTVLGVVLLVGALQIPVPAVSVAFSVGPRPDPTPTVTAFDTPPGPPEPVDADLTIISRIPTPPPPPPAPTSVATGTSEPLTQEPIPQPRFTPMSVRPALLNAQEVQQALMREYPTMLRDAGIGGAPVLWIYIGDDGAVRRTEVVESSGHAALDEAARKVAEAMRFTPARNRDQEVAVWVQIPIRFQVVN